MDRHELSFRLSAPNSALPPDGSFPLSTWTQHRAAIGGLIKNGYEPDDPVVTEARRDLKAARLADYISRVVDEAPPLSPEQRDRLAVLLRGGATA